MSPVRRTLSVDGLVSVQCVFGINQKAFTSLKCGSLLTEPQAEGLSARKERNCMTLERKKQRLLEREVSQTVLFHVPGLLWFYFPLHI